MEKIIYYKLSNKINNYKKIASVEERVEKQVEERVEERLEERVEKQVEESIKTGNKIITNKSIISEKKAYLQLLDKIKTSIATSNTANSNIANSKTNITYLSSTIISIYDNCDKQLLC